VVDDLATERDSSTSPPALSSPFPSFSSSTSPVLPTPPTRKIASTGKARDARRGAARRAIDRKNGDDDDDGDDEV
jgi:hypothetical protein